MPTESSAVSTYLAYSSEEDPEIGPTAFTALFKLIHDHCAKWSDLESDIKMIGADLNIFGRKFVIIGQDVVDIIDEMPISVRAKTKVGTSDISLSFDEEDKDAQCCLLEMLNDLKLEVVKRLENTQALVAKIEDYRQTMDNKIVPEAAKKEDGLGKLNFDTKNAQLLSDIVDFQEEIEQLDKQYDTMVGLAFTGAAGMIIPLPVGIITWAITGGVFGGLAESVRKSRNDKQTDMDNKQSELDSSQAFAKAVTDMRMKTTEMNHIIGDAAIGIRNLETLWKNVYSDIEHASSELEEITEYTRLILFSAKMKSAVASWREVADITGELVALFERAQREAMAS